MLAEVKDIRDELHMFSKIFEDQLQVLPDLSAVICKTDDETCQNRVQQRFADQFKLIKGYIEDINRMDKYINAFQACFTRDQATSTTRQGEAITVFTIVTIVFLPLSFITAFFTVDITEFPHEDGSSSLSLGFVMKYTFGIDLGISVPLIVLALSLNNIKTGVKRLRRTFHHNKASQNVRATFKDRSGRTGGLDDLENFHTHTLRVARSTTAALPAMKSGRLSPESMAGSSARRRRLDRGSIVFTHGLRPAGEEH
ncbi:hypothetical protein BDZ45DRAFT_755158 [Acephala macrosclerotiorum]|nr:hypothetical protein BDZ45DRAFT_755158 [Acephala macrosclerotiorum]